MGDFGCFLQIFANCFMLLLYLTSEAVREFNLLSLFWKYVIRQSEKILFSHGFTLRARCHEFPVNQRYLLLRNIGSYSPDKCSSSSFMVFMNELSRSTPWV